MPKIRKAFRKPWVSVTIDGRKYREAVTWQRYALLALIWPVTCGLVLALLNLVDWRLAALLCAPIGWGLVQMLLLQPGRVTCGREIVVLASPLAATGTAYLLTKLLCALFASLRTCSSESSQGFVLFSLLLQFVPVAAAVIWLRWVSIRSPSD